MRRTQQQERRGDFRQKDSKGTMSWSHPVHWNDETVNYRGKQGLSVGSWDTSCLSREEQAFRESMRS